MKLLYSVLFATLLGVTIRIHYIIIYVTSSNKIKKIIMQEVYNLLENKRIRNKNLGNILSLLLLLHLDKYYKTIFFHRTKTNYISRLLKSDNKMCFIIPYDVSLGGNIKYDHPYGTILNAKYIGDNFQCKHLTTIGNKDDNEDFRPTILNNVKVGANVTIIGKITIGNNVTIGAGTIVTKDIPDNSTIVSSSHIRFLNI